MHVPDLASARHAAGPWGTLAGMETQPYQAATVLPPVPTAPREARRFVTTTLQRWHADDVCDVVELLTSELVTNAVLHARTSVTVRVVRCDDAVRVEVADGSPAVPTPRLYSDDAVTGRGLQLVESLAERWGVEAGGGAKTMWFEVRP
jgi:anti-sigma regulatory factor (Ser/Thr protein kinase)